MLKNRTLTTDANADFIFKKGNYINTYIVVSITGTPDNITLSLVDENLHQLYSPYDVNENLITSACSVTVGEDSVIQLPANFNNNLSAWEDFDAGIYNWNLYWAGNEYYNAITIPLTVEIRNFSMWGVIDTDIYSDEDITVQIRTYIDTIPSSATCTTPNATYNNATGIITIPNSDINDLSIGEHTQIINQANNCVITYNVKDNSVVSDINIVNENLSIDEINVHSINNTELVTGISIENNDIIVTTRIIADENNITGAIQRMNIDSNGDIIYTQVEN